MTQTNQGDRRKDVAKTGNYDIYIDIDCDCEELLDAIGLEYTTSEDDEHQNEVKLILDKDEWLEFKEDIDFNYADEQTIGHYLLNHELGEYVTRVQIYNPSGDKITFE